MLLSEKRKGTQEKICSVNSWEDKVFLEKMGYPSIPWTYGVKTRTFMKPEKLPPIVKDIHYAAKRGKKEMYIHLIPAQVSTLREYGVEVRVVKYKVRLA